MFINDGGSAVRPAGGKYGIATEVSTITSVPRSQKGFGYSKTWYRETGTSSYVKGNSNSQNTAVFGLEINPYSSTTPITQFYESRMNIGKLTYGGHIDLTGTRSCQEISKQICLYDLAQDISILFIIQIVEAI